MAVWVLGLVTSGLAAAALSALALGVIALTGMMHLLGAHAGASGQP